eukprot:1279188-Alexandrium_andersonii.AAC.1
MSASLVGSEMCIRDSAGAALNAVLSLPPTVSSVRKLLASHGQSASQGGLCLLYTSDAADDM